MDNTNFSLVLSQIAGFMGAIPFEEETDSEEERVENELREELSKAINRNEPHRVEGYIERVIPSFTAKEFQSHFRLSRPAFECLLECLHPLLLPTQSIRPPIEPEKQLLVTLWLLATPDSYRSVGDRFNMGKSSAHRSFVKVVEALNKIAPRVIKWPTQEESSHIQEQFQRFSGLRGVIGAIDGTYVHIKAPSLNPEKYINRKCFYGITLQAIAIPSLKFTDCFTGYPSSVGDRRIFNNSDIFKNISSNPPKYIYNNSYIIGDKAYPVLDWCIPPYIDRGSLTSAQTNFNTTHAKTRQVIERAFALLFGRFRRLKYVDMTKTNFIPPTIMACCVLHNICLQYEDLLIPEYIQQGTVEIFGDESTSEIRNEASNANGISKRDQLAGQVYRN